MAEFVQQYMEEMLPELEQMERVGLFTAPETKSILKKRKGYEYKLRRKIKEKADFLQYAQYEMHCLALVKKRRERSGYKYKKEEIEFAILRRIHRIFTMACNRFQEDFKLWLSYIEFAKKAQEKDKVSKLFARMLQVHGKKPDLWIMAAKWEMEQNSSMDNARLHLQQGIRFNKDNKQLWQEYFRMELLNAEKMRKRKEILTASGIEQDSKAASESVHNGKVAEIVYIKAMETLSDVQFGLSFIKIAELFNFTKALIEALMEHLGNWFSESEYYLDMVARRHFHEASVEAADLSKKETRELFTEKENQAWCAYDQAVQTVSTGLMWTLYMDGCLERLNIKGGAALSQNRLERILYVFTRAADAGHMDEAHFLSWMEVLQKCGQPLKAAEVVAEGTTRWPHSVPLWQQRLLASFQMNADLKTVKDLMDKASLSIKSKEALPLWESAIHWCIITNPQSVTEFFEAAVLHCNCAEIKELYVEYAGKTGTKESVRSLFRGLISSKPHSLNLFRKFIAFENAQAKPNIAKLRDAYEQALDEYGNESVEIWLDYMQMETEHPKGQAENVSNLHWKAMRTLDGSMSEKFVALYSLRQTGVNQ